MIALSIQIHTAKQRKTVANDTVQVAEEQKETRTLVKKNKSKENKLKSAAFSADRDI